MHLVFLALYKWVELLGRLKSRLDSACLEIMQESLAMSKSQHSPTTTVLNRDTWVFYTSRLIPKLKKKEKSTKTRAYIKSNARHRWNLPYRYPVKKLYLKLQWYWQQVCRTFEDCGYLDLKNWNTFAISPPWFGIQFSWSCIFLVNKNV